jgi:hypothetical protein
LKFLFFLVLLPAAFVEIFVHHRFGISLLGALWFGLMLQADRAARRFLRDGLTPQKEAKEEAPWLPPEEDELIYVRRFARDKPQAQTEEPEAHPETGRFLPPPQKEEKRTSASGNSRKSNQSKRKADPAPAPKAGAKPSPLPKAPDFSGAPHEVLGVPERAATRTIGNAFRHWIKQFHPDLGHPENNGLARQLVQARATLLARRKSRSSQGSDSGGNSNAA